MWVILVKDAEGLTDWAVGDLRVYRDFALALKAREECEEMDEQLHGKRRTWAVFPLVE